MSKVVTSEFERWESLYWPEGVPRTIEGKVEGNFVSGSADAHLHAKPHLLDYRTFGTVVDVLAKEISQSGKSESLYVPSSSQLGILLGTVLSIKAKIPVTVASDASSVKSSLELRQSGPSGDPLRDFGIEGKPGDAAPAPAGAKVILLVGNNLRITYDANDLGLAARSLGAFLKLGKDSHVGVVSPLWREFGLVTAVTALASGATLSVFESVSELKSAGNVSVLLVGRDVLADNKSQSLFMEFCRSGLRGMRDSASFVGVQNPASVELTRGLERELRVPVLQMFGLSGRGIVFSNPPDFNVHGSAGIPITNVEAVMADNYEGNWIRERVLQGPGTEGEVIVRGSFIDPRKKVGDPKQAPVLATIGEQSTQWSTTGITGKMDENGFFYPNESSMK